VQDRQLRIEVVRKAQQRRRQRQPRRAGRGRGIARLFVSEGVTLKCIQLNSLGLDVPRAHFEIVVAMNPGKVRRDTPVRILAQGLTADAEVGAAAGGPI
jgi:hypothetical protein